MFHHGYSETVSMVERRTKYRLSYPTIQKKEILMEEKKPCRTFRNLARVIEGITVVVLAEPVGFWQEGDRLVVAQVLKDQGVVRCRKFGGDELGLISMDTKIKDKEEV